MIEVPETILIRQKILENCLELYKTPITLAAKQPANNKLDLERIRYNDELRELVVPAMGDLVLQYKPDFTVGVPNGATWLSDAIATEIDCYTTHLQRDESGAMDYEDQQIDWELVVSPLTRGVMIEDVFNRFTNTRRALTVPRLGEKIVGIVGVWDRGVGHVDRQAPSQPYQALITEHIDEMLPYDSSLLR